ncbi:MAG: NAD(P)/FAD-dependent oxidoreductase [Hyphomicrobiales bacterium]|nr:NAD(P)/FAD-dependent oxidoreductase [Hyphomicrobiales bacterium]
MSEASTGRGTATDFDPAVLRDRYRAERDRRLRADGEEQYVAISGKYAHYADEDPYVVTPIERAPLTDEVEVVIVGGGWAGLITAARLREAGLRDIRIIEAGADFGGTWYWNRYPGAQCDIEAYCYLPLLEETGYLPTEKYAFAPEIFAHAQRIGRHFGLYESACFQTRVTELRWEEDSKRWIVETNRGDRMKARFAVLACGPANRPKLPGIPGIDDFEGHTFHTSRWDYAYTGGDNKGGLTKLADKRIAIIGTGATAIQCVPHVAAYAEHLYVFQRTPSSVDFRGNKPTDPEWAKALKPGWQRERQENFNDVVTGRPFEVDLVSDAWTDIFRNLQSLFPVGADSGLPPEEADRLGELVDFQKMNQIRARVDATVKDPRIADALKPWYRQFCKRPTFNDEYLPAFNRPNVTLVDTSANRGVERITARGVVANGIEYEVDCIIYATGFEISTPFRRRIGFEVFGAEGRSLFDHWAKGMRTFHGHSTHGFPNWFYVGASQNGVSVNYSSMVDDQARHIAYIINEGKARQATRVQPTAEAEAEWVSTIRSLAMNNRTFMENCTPGYYNNEGKFDLEAGTFGGDVYTPGANAFNALLAEWRKKGDLPGMQWD